jgi:RND family efflux transporter MFP subunit
VALTQARRDTLPIKLAANGSVAAWQEASVGAEVGGLRVAELRANVGDLVKKGQVLANLAAESVQADVALARAGLLEAQANAAEAHANAERARAVQSSGALSAQQVSQYLTQEQTAQARVASTQAQLDVQLLRLKQTQVLAPDSGIISSRTATVGAVLGAGTELFKLIRQGRLEWRGEVTSAELSHLSIGAPVLVTAPGGAQAKGRVRTLAPIVDAASRNGLVYVDLPAAPAFKAGMFARGEFDLGTSAALTVPQTAVVVRDGFSYVYRVAADHRVSQLKVQTGRVLGEHIEIQSGIQPNDQLVASGGSFLSDGDLVRVVDEPNKNSAAAKEPPSQAATK